MIGCRGSRTNHNLRKEAGCERPSMRLIIFGSRMSATYARPHRPGPQPDRVELADPIPRCWGDWVTPYRTPSGVHFFISIFSDKMFIVVMDICIISILGSHYASR